MHRVNEYIIALVLRDIDLDSTQPLAQQLNLDSVLDTR